VIVSCLSYILEEFVTFEFFEDVTLVLHQGVVVEQGDRRHQVALLSRGLFGGGEVQRQVRFSFRLDGRVACD
jgi:hypothetical protein